MTEYGSRIAPTGSTFKATDDPLPRYGINIADLAADCRAVTKMRLPTSGRVGWSPKMRARFGYYTPDEV